MNICEVCNTTFTPKQHSKGRFCSQICFNVLRRKLRTKTCEYCKEDFQPGRDNRARYCSRSCAAKSNNHSRIRVPKKPKEPVPSKRELNLKNWLNGEDWSYVNGHLPATARRFLLEEADHKCPKCGWGEKNPVIGKVILTIDHRDGNWTNNRKENLEVLCYNCHTLTSTFGSLNVGSKSGRRLGANDRDARWV